MTIVRLTTGLVFSIYSSATYKCIDILIFGIMVMVDADGVGVGGPGLSFERRGSELKRVA